MTGLRVAAVCVVAIVLQLTVFVDVRISGVAPELLALVAVLAGLFAGPDRGPTVGFAAGMLWDVYLPTPLGVAAIVFAMAAYVVAVLVAGLFHDSLVQLVAVAWAATTGAVIGYALLAEVVGARGLVDVRMLKVALVAGFMNAVLAPLAAPLVRWAVGAAHSTRPTTPLPVR